MVNYYQVLGVDRRANCDEIRTAYRQLLKKWHPDKFQNAGEAEKQEATRKTRQILLAWYHLSDTGRRSSHDHALSANGKSAWRSPQAPPDEAEAIFRRVVEERVKAGIPRRQAVQMVLDEVTALANTLLAILDYPPNAITQYVLANKLAERGATYTADELMLAMTALQRAGKLYADDGRWGVRWFAKLRDPIDFSKWTDDDQDWYFGTGRFAQ
jgi:curved DNA-binding protein CbpA